MKMNRTFLCLALMATFFTAFSQNTNAGPVKTGPAFLGVSTTDYPELEEGVLVEGVYKGYGAAEAGLQRGDILLAINGDDVNSTRELSKELRGYKNGDQVEVKYLRFNKEMTAKANLSDKPKYSSDLKMVRRDEANGKARDGKKAFMGIYPKTDWQNGGVRITGFTSKSQAWRAGLEEGDIITKLDEASISTSDQLNNYLWEKTPGAEMKVTFLRNGKEKNATMTLGETISDDCGNCDSEGISNGFGGNFDFDLDNPEKAGERAAELAERMEEMGERLGREGEKLGRDIERRAEDWSRDFERGWNQNQGRGSNRNRDSNPENWSSGGSFFSLSDFSATPNPTSGNVTVSFSGKSNQPFSVVITNEDGREIAREEREELAEGLFTQQFDLTKAAAGIYYCRIYKGENVVASQKIEKN